MASFELRVTFTGLNLFLAHKDGNEVAVLQPDSSADPRHVDGSVGIPHVGYLRFNLANLCRCLPAGPVDSIPRGEGVYRFKGHTLEFGISGVQPIMVRTPFTQPDFHDFAPTVEVPFSLFSGTPDRPLLMRTILRGGKLGIGETPTDTRQLPQVLNPAPTEPAGEFKNTVTWKREMDGDGLTLTVRDFMGSVEARFPLEVVGETRVIELKIANLCSQNPLQWKEFPFSEVRQDDEDFKWLYRLLTLPGGKDFAAELKGSPFPIPRLLNSGGSGVENCMGAIKHGQTFSLPDGATFFLRDGDD